MEKENKMGTGAIPSLLLKTAIPLMLSLLANNLYNMVDSIFISHMSEDALTALSMASPVQQLMAALGCGIAVGLNAAVVNLVLDPFLIFGFPGFAPMGTAGAALATVIGQSCGAVLGVILNIRYNKEIPIRFTIKPDGRMILDILRVGIPTSIMQGLVSVMGIVMNTILYGFSSTAVAVYGICARIQNLAGIPVHGIDNGLIPIVAYNYGARKRKRVDESIRWAFIYAMTLTGIVIVLLEMFPAPLLALFDASETMLAIGVPAIRILAVGWLLSVFGFVIGTAFQALGNGGYSMYVTVMRQVALPIGFAVLLSRTGNLRMIWVAFLMAEILTIPLVVFLFGKTKRMVLNRL